MKILEIITESHNKCPHCGGPIVSESELMEKKDACYYKIKSSAKVWPSAYASGRLVQCRKKGAANYGNKSESVSESENAILSPGTEVTVPHKGKMVPGKIVRYDSGKGIDSPAYIVDISEYESLIVPVSRVKQDMDEGFSLPTMEGIKNWLLKLKQGLSQEADESSEMLDVYARYTQGFPVNAQEMTVANEQLKDVARGIGMGIFAAIPGHVITVPILFGLAKKFNIQLLPSAFNSPNHAVAEGENWSKHNNPRAGGMSKKSVNSYRRSHPGSKIQTAVTTKPSKLKKGSKAAARRKSFCARMRGMKKHRTGAKTAHDPNSNINKSLRRWHCESIEELNELVMLAEQFIRNNKK